MRSLDEQWEQEVHVNASALAYPPTPDIADQVMARLHTGTAMRPHAHHLQPTWVMALLLALVVSLLAVPSMRAAVLEFLQVGAVRIWLDEPASPTRQAGGRTTAGGTSQSAVPLESRFGLAGATTLADAEARAGFAIHLPTYPSTLGLPDGVFYQELGGPVVVLVWMDPKRPDEARFTLHILGDRVSAEKSSPAVVMTTTVNGNPAVWAEGPYVLAYGEENQTNWELRYLVSGRVLIWTQDGLTYRLESNLSVEEAVRMAESLE